MDVRAPTTQAEAESLVGKLLDRWDTGGREQLYAVFSQAPPTLESSFDPAAVFPMLLVALLTSHVASPRLATKAIATLVRTVAEACGGSEAAASSPPAGVAAPADATGESAAEHAVPSVLVDAVLDGIWAVDTEIDTRAELLSQGPLWPGGDEEQSLADAAAQSKARLADVVKEFLREKLLPRVLVAERLEVPLLRLVGLVEDMTAFTRKGVRMNTANLYKQQKFNLLREENEGYAGLLNELIGGMGPAVVALREEAAPLAPGEAAPETSCAPLPRPVDGRAPFRPDRTPVRVVEQESSETRNARARKTMGNISALIGYFDLDPNRVLDITLDVFSSNITQHWPFFLALFAVSPWGPDRRKEPADAPAANGDAAMDVDEAPAPRLGPVTLDFRGEPGNHTVAQVLGFKFGYYQQADNKEDTPEELYVMAALLIREGFVRFSDLFTHLSPDDAGMAKLQAAYRDSLGTPAATVMKMNALTMAAPLVDEYTRRSDAAAAATDAANKKKEEAEREPPNQITGLLKALLATGQLKHGIYILSQHPWLCGSEPGVAERYARLLGVLLEPAVESISLGSLYLDDVETPGAEPRETRGRQSGPPKLVLTLNAPEATPTASAREAFFYPAWREGLPGVSCDSLLAEFVPLLRLLGPHLAKDLELFRRLCRLVKLQVRKTLATAEEDEQAALLRPWLEILRSIILPALSCTQHDVTLADEVWSIINRLPYAQRYALYGEWKYVLYQQPELKARKLATEREAKGILKRINTEMKSAAARDAQRQLANSAHANPCIFFTEALTQVQAYDNFIAPIVESAKFLSDLSYDVFTWVLLDALSNPAKERTKQDGTNISLWLKALSAFSGNVYRRYKKMDVGPVLQYIANQLKQNNSKDLVLLRELVLKMAGIEPLANLGDKQVAALTGGRLLRREAMIVANAGIGTEAREDFHDDGARLLQCLERSRMAVPLLVLVAQQRQACIYLTPESEATLKYMANLFDSCQETLFQYVEFLHNQLQPAAYSKLVPTLDDLCMRFGIEPAIGFHIVRPRLQYAVRAADAEENEQRLKAEAKAKADAKAEAKAAKADARAAKAEAKKAAEASAAAEGDAAEPDVGQPAEADASASQEQSVDKAADGAAPTADVAMDVDPKPESNGAAAPDSSAEAAPAKQIWRTGMKEAIEVAERLLPDSVQQLLGPHFYATFWQLALSDITVPVDRYDSETKALTALVRQETERRGAPSRAGEQARDALAGLKTEFKAQTLSHSATQRRLAVEKDHWFPNAASSTERAQIVYQLLQFCIIPRALLSPTDAIFAGRFIRTMHANGARNFSSLTAYDKIFVDHVASVIFSCTENEARNYARFLQQILSDLSAWHADQALYNKEAIGEHLPGFQMRWGARHGGEPIPQADFCPWESFRQVHSKWHNCLKLAFKECLGSGEYMRIRNAIVVMTRIAQLFPLLDQHGEELMAAVHKLSESEPRDDLKVLALGLHATLKKRQKQWLQPHKFRKIVNPPAATPAAPTTPTTPTAAAKSAAPAAAIPTGPKASSIAAAGPPSGPAADRARLASGLSKPATPAQSPPPKAQAASTNGADTRLPARPATGRPNGAAPSAPTADRNGAAVAPAEGARPAPASAASATGDKRADAARDAPAPAEREAPSVSAARQAVLDSMNPPKRPANTASAQLARERGGARSGTATPAHARDEDVAAAPRAAPQAAAAADAPSERRPASSREVSPRRSRAPSADSSHSRSQSGRERGERSDRSDRDRSDRERERERDRERDRDRDRRERDRPQRSAEPEREAAPRNMYAGMRDRSERRGADEPSPRPDRSDRGERADPHASRRSDRYDPRAERSTRADEVASPREARSRDASGRSDERRRDGRGGEVPSPAPRGELQNGQASGKEPSARHDSPAGMPSPMQGQKRSLADRFVDAGPGPTPEMQRAPRDDAEGPDSKRVKIQRERAAGRGGRDAERDSDRHASRQDARDVREDAASQSQGISIRGGGSRRSSGAPGAADAGREPAPRDANNDRAPRDAPAAADSRDPPRGPRGEAAPSNEAPPRGPRGERSGRGGDERAPPSAPADDGGDRRRKGGGHRSYPSGGDRDGRRSRSGRDRR